MGLTILCVSQLSAAQVTRNLVLEQAGYSVVATDDPAEAERIFRRGEISAVVFGETVLAEQRIELGTNFKRIKPRVPIVFLYRMNGFRLPAWIADEQVEYLGGPTLLLQALHRALGNGTGDSAQDEE